jgi:DNA-binding MarR family transcriptional regulator
MLLNDLSIIVRHSRIFSERKLNELDIGFPEQLILMYLIKYGTVNQETISKYFLVDKGSIAKTIYKLEQKKLIKKQRNTLNRREKLIALTKNGECVTQHMKTLLEEWNRHIYEGLTEEDIAQISRISEIMATNAAKITNKDWSVSVEKPK